MLILMGQPASERSGTGDRAFMAFKLHRFSLVQATCTRRCIHPVCAENLVRFDLMTESPNVGRADIPPER